MASVFGEASPCWIHAGVRLSEVDKDARVLTDILGMGDYLGSMDFKLVATSSGLCIIQAFQ